MSDVDTDHFRAEMERLNVATDELLRLFRERAAQQDAAVQASQAAAGAAGQHEADTRALFEQTAQHLADMQNALSQATAVVFGGEHSITPKAGSVPIAGDDGALAAAWLSQGVLDLLMGTHRRQIDLMVRVEDLLNQRGD